MKPSWNGWTVCWKPTNNKNFRVSLGRIDASVPLPLTPDCTWFRGFFVPRGTAGEKEKGAGSCVFLHSWNDDLCKNTHIDGFKPLIRCNMAVLGRQRGVCFFAMRKVRIRIMDLERFRWWKKDMLFKCIIGLKRMAEGQYSCGRERKKGDSHGKGWKTTRRKPNPRKRWK